jgi:thiol-disulfide isomerase/thioredoxin
VVLSRPTLPGAGTVNEDERLLGLQELANASSFCVTSAAAGLFQLQVFAVNHFSADALIWAPGGSKHQVSIRLAAPAIAPDLSTAKAVCYQFVPSFRQLEDAPLLRQPDGRYRATIKGQDVPAHCGLYGVSRQVCVGVEPKGPDCIQGTQADEYALNRAFGVGRYSAVVTPANSKGFLVLDPAALPQSREPLSVEFPVEAATNRRLTEVWMGILARDLQNRGDASPVVSPSELDAALRAAQGEPDAILRQALWASYVSMATAGSRRHASERTTSGHAGVARALRELTPASAFWPLIRTRLFDAVWAAGLPLTPDGYAGDVVRHLPTPSERPLTISAFAAAARRQGDGPAFNAWLAWLLGEYEEHYLARAARERYGANDRVQIGKPFPEFAVRSLDDESAILSVKTIGARYLLVDFWATWCGPCIAEIPALQKAYDRFSGQGFQILSYSLDMDGDVVRQFRRGRYRMPWLHAVYAGGWERFSTDFGFFSIPAPVLLDSGGRVIALRDELMGGRLESLLERLIR